MKPYHQSDNQQPRPTGYPPTTTTTTTATNLPSKLIHTTQSDLNIISSPSPSSSPRTNQQKNTNTSKSSSLRNRSLNTAFGPISLDKFLRRDWIKYYILLIIIIISIAIVSVYHHQIIIALHPWAQSMRDLKVNNFEVGWLIPVLILFIISFPPLFGHEIVIILCGLVWGLWFGFAIASLGTLLGELGNYFAFKYACSHRAKRLEKKDMNFACMCTVVRQGGFWIAFLARLSAIPGHLVTPVFATTGMSLFVFTSAAILSMPKQLSGVYIGTLFTTDETDHPKPTGVKAVQYSVLALTFFVTVFAAVYIYRQMSKVRAEVERSWQEEGRGLEGRDTPESQQVLFNGIKNSFPLVSDRRDEGFRYSRQDLTGLEGRKKTQGEVEEEEQELKLKDRGQIGYMSSSSSLDTSNGGTELYGRDEEERIDRFYGGFKFDRGYENPHRQLDR